MSATTAPRGLPAKVAKMKARKQKKLAPAVDAVDKSTRGASSKKRKASADDLRWKKASFPEGMDDMEGLYGDFFEELSDTEVVREGGKVLFQYKQPNKKQKGGHEEVDGSVDGDVEQHNEDDDDEDEWGGIDDEDGPLPSSLTAEAQAMEAEEPTSPQALSKAQKRAAQKAERKAAQGKGATITGTKHDRMPQTPFSVLGNAEEDEEDGVDTSAWNKLRLTDSVLDALSKLKFTKPTPIQAAAIPHVLAGGDLIGKAPTGSGKTLAFGIPIYDYWLAHHSHKEKAEDEDKQPTALIVLPTRELAHQIAEHLTSLCSQPHLRSPVIATVTGGLSIQKQKRILAQADIVIATPGRLWEVINEIPGTLSSLKGIKFLVIDEADRLLSEGHFKELSEVLTALDRKITNEDDSPTTPTTPTPRQTLVFSATFSKTLHQKLSKQTYNSSRSSSSSDLLTNQASMEYLLHKLSFTDPKPRFIDINPLSQMAATLREGLVECAAATDKDLYLYTLLLYHPNTRALVFVNSIAAVRRLVPFLSNLNLTAYPLHSQMPQKARLRSIERFSAPLKPPPTPPSGAVRQKPGGNQNTMNRSTSQILVATDVAARGLDIPDVRLVLHYHVPRTADTYVHRSGRTARAENPGSSILMCAPLEAAGVRRLVAKVHVRDAAGKGKGRKQMGKKEAHYYMRTLDVDARVVSALRPRATLAKRLADAQQAKEKQGRADEWFAKAAEELGVDVDEEEFEAEVEAQGGGHRGRGKGRKEKEKAAGEMTRAEMGALRAELRELLGKRVNVGVSERYLTGGNVDVDALLRGQREGMMGGEFLGRVPELGFED